MNLESLRKKIERLVNLHELEKDYGDEKELEGIKQTIKSVDKFITIVAWDNYSKIEQKEWQKIKELLGIEEQTFEKKLIKQLQQYNGQIKSIKDLFEFLDRVTKCSDCKRIYWDCLCPDCINKYYIHKEDINEAIDKAIKDSIVYCNGRQRLIDLKKELGLWE